MYHTRMQLKSLTVRLMFYIRYMYVYRWCERTDVVEKARAAFGLKPALPDFYNILLERPRHDPAGYGK